MAGGSQDYRIIQDNKPNYYTKGYNDAIDHIDQLSPDVEELAKLMYEKRISLRGYSQNDFPLWQDMIIENHPMRLICLTDAQEIINKMNEWIVKKG